MFIKKILPVVILAAFSTQPMFAADSSTSATGSSAPASMNDTSTGTGTSTTGTGANTGTTTNSTTTTSATGMNTSSDMDQCNCHCKKDHMQMLESLQLTDAQKTQIKAIKDKTRASIEDNKEQLKSIRTQMHSLIASSSLDNSKLDALISQKTTILANMMRVKATAKNQVYNVLNAQQQQQFRQMMEEKHTHHKCH